MKLPPWVAARVEALRQQGLFADAARLCVAHGAYEEASRYYAEAWDWTAAIRAAERGQLWADAYRVARRAGRAEEAERALRNVMAVPDAAAGLAEALSRDGHSLDLARLYEAAGALEAAATAYTAVAEDAAAGACWERLGRLTDAGRAYERALRAEPDAAHVAVRLGRILALAGRFEAALVPLQRAAEAPAERAEAERWLIGCFDALGLDEAAFERLAALRVLDPTTPTTTAAYLAAAFGDGGLSGLVERPEGALLVGRYRVLRPLGEGATGRVVAAEDVLDGDEVAVKILTVGDAMGGRDAEARFVREAQLASTLRHPRLVSVRAFHPESSLLVLELMRGGTLEERLERAAREGTRLDDALVPEIGAAILDGLEALHGRGVVHGDLKPANVFFGALNELKLGDFGTASLLDHSVTQSGGLEGSLAYMAPERVSNACPPGAASDLYALGVILFRMLTGRLPFVGPDLAGQQLDAAPPRLRALRPELPEALDALVAELLAKDPAERPLDAAEARARLEAVSLSAVSPSAAVDSPAPVSDGASHDEDARYLSLEANPASGARRFFDRWLEREVWALPRTPALTAVCRAAARAEARGLQRVYGLDERWAYLEAPRGRPLQEARLEPHHRATLREALAALHEAGVVHGGVTAATVFVDDERAVLLLPTEPAVGDAASDEAALEALLSR